MRRYLLETSAGKDEAARPSGPGAKISPTSRATAALKHGSPVPRAACYSSMTAWPVHSRFRRRYFGAGPHRVGIETKRKRPDGKVEITAGRGIEVLFDLASAVPVSAAAAGSGDTSDRPERGVIPPDSGKLTAATQEAISSARSAVQVPKAARRAGLPRLFE